MSKEKSELDEFMAGLGGSSESPEEQKAEDPFNHLEQKENEEETTVEVKDEKPLPFNKDPKIQKYLDKREKEIEERLASKFGDRQQSTAAPVADTEREELMAQVFGNDTPEKVATAKRFMNYLDTLKGSAKQEALEEFQSLQNAEVEADKEAEDEVESAFSNLEEKYDVDLLSGSPLANKLHNDFKAYCTKIAPKDEYGEVKEFPDFDSAWEEFSEKRKLTAPVNRNKDLASRSMRRSAETSSEPVLKRGGQAFRNSDEFIESLSR